MYAIVLDYLVPLERIDEALDAHDAWLDVQYAAGRFLASGRRVPRVGGVILAADMPRDELDAMIALDPFAEHALATHQVLEFHPSRIGAAIDGAGPRAAFV